MAPSRRAAYASCVAAACGCLLLAFAFHCLQLQPAASSAAWQCDGSRACTATLRWWPGDGSSVPPCSCLGWPRRTAGRAAELSPAWCPCAEALPGAAAARCREAAGRHELLHTCHRRCTATGQWWRGAARRLLCDLCRSGSSASPRGYCPPAVLAGPALAWTWQLLEPQTGSAEGAQAGSAGGQADGGGGGGCCPRLGPPAPVRIIATSWKATRH